ncbi:hypothetical protein [Nonomuraea zeae]|uniref:hypothetical protein n=1 Tax=Nonomuraea zeae TaxID=1642303 RepID=UPI00360A76D8
MAGRAGRHGRRRSARSRGGDPADRGGFEDYTDRGWNLIDVLRDRLIPLGIPILGGLEVGHGPDPHAVPLGTVAELDTGRGTLTLRPPAQ